MIEEQNNDNDVQIDLEDLPVARPPTPPRRRAMANNGLPADARVMNFNAVQLGNWLVLAVKVIAASFCGFIFFVVEYFVS
jgi:hypothetical protein